MPRPAPLRLTASTPEGLALVSAAAQDGLVKASDIAFDAKRRRFSFEMNRFQWENAGERGPYFRARAILAFDTVLSVKTRGMPPRGDDEILALLSAVFEPGDEAPAGGLRLSFAGGAEIMLDVECVDATLIDGDKIWPTRRKPDHDKRQQDGAL